MIPATRKLMKCLRSSLEPIEAEAVEGYQGVEGEAAGRRFAAHLLQEDKMSSAGSYTG